MTALWILLGLFLVSVAFGWLLGGSERVNRVLDACLTGRSVDAAADEAMALNADPLTEAEIAATDIDQLSGLLLERNEL